MYVDGVSPFFARYLPEDDTTDPTATPANTSGSGAYDWTKVPGGETTHQVVAGENLTELAIHYYGVADQQSFDDIALANPTKVLAGVAPQNQILHTGTLEILSPERCDEIRTVQKDFSAVKSAEAALAAWPQELPIAVRRMGHGIAEDDRKTLEEALTTAQDQLHKDLLPLLQPAEGPQYSANVGGPEAVDLKGILTDPELQGYIDTTQQSLQLSVDQFFGKAGDPKSLRAEIDSGDWGAAEHTAEQEIAAAGQGISDPAQKQSAMLQVAQQLLAMGPTSSQYVAGVNQAFDNLVVQPLVDSLNKVYANESQAEKLGLDAAAYPFGSRGAFAHAFQATMTSAAPQVRVTLMQDLLQEKNSPLLAAATDLRNASNHPLTFRPQDVQYSSSQDLAQAYSDLSAGCDLVAVSDTVGTGDPTGMIHQVAQAILGDPNSAGSANLQALAPAITSAAANGNINLTTEMAGILSQSGKTTQASALLGEASKGISQLQDQIKQDTTNMLQLPTDVGIPVKSAGSIFSNPQTTIDATNKYLAAHPDLNEEVQQKIKQDLAALDRDGQAVVRINYAVENSSADLSDLPGAQALTWQKDTLTNGPEALFAVSVSPSAQAELYFRGQQQVVADAIRTGQTVDVGGRGWQHLPAGVLWIGRDITGFYGAVRAKGFIPPFNLRGSSLASPGGLSLDMTGTVAQQINDLSREMLGSNAPLNIDGVQAQIAGIKNRMIELQFGPWKGTNSAANQRITSLQDTIATDPNNIALQKLNNQLTVTSDPQQRLQILQKISDVKAKSVMDQLDALQKAAGDDQGRVQQINNLRTSYQAAQQRMDTVTEVSAKFQIGPTPQNLTAWLNEAGKAAGADLQNPQFANSADGLALEQSLSAANLDPQIKQALLEGKYAGSISALPEGVVEALQQYTVSRTALGSGPKPGLLPTAEGGLGFSFLKTLQMWGGMAYLAYLGWHPGQKVDAQSLAFAGGLAAFSVAPSTAEFWGGVLQRSNAGGMLGDASLFARGIGGSWVGALGSVADWAWVPLMGWWAIDAYHGGNPIVGTAAAGAGASYLLPELFAESSWALPAAAIIDIVGIGVIVADTIYTTNKAIHRYDGDIKDLLTQAGVKPDVANALAQPDDQGVAGALRMGKIFDSVPYYNTPNPQLNDQRRLAYLNSLTSQQASMLSGALVNIPIDKKGEIPKTGALNVSIPPPSPPLVMTPDQIKQYYNEEYFVHGLSPPPDPSSLPGGGLSQNLYLDYYEMYTANLANVGPDRVSTTPFLIWSGLENKRDHVGPQDVAVYPTSIQGFMYFADLAGIPLQGATP